MIATGAKEEPANADMCFPNQGIDFFRVNRPGPDGRQIQCSRRGGFDSFVHTINRDKFILISQFFRLVEDGLVLIQMLSGFDLHSR